jgi:hypothetical protein
LSAPSKAQLFSTSSLANAVESATNASTNAKDGRVTRKIADARIRKNRKASQSANSVFSRKKSEILAPFWLVIRRANRPSSHGERCLA